VAKPGPVFYDVVRPSPNHHGLHTTPPPPPFDPKVAEAQARAILAALQGGAADAFSHVVDGVLSARPLPSGAKAVGLLEGDAASSSPPPADHTEESGSVGYPADWATWAATVPDPRLSQQQSFQSEVKVGEPVPRHSLVVAFGGQRIGVLGRKTCLLSTPQISVHH